MTIISDLKKLKAPILDQDFELGRPSINGVLDQFFESMHRSNDDLSCSDLIDYILLESLAWY